MNREERKEKIGRLKGEYGDIKAPEEGRRRMELSMERAVFEKRRMRRMRRIKQVGIGVAAALAVMVALPNASGSVAMAMEKVPGLGGFIRVVTFGRYDFEDENHSASVKVPKLEREETGESGEENAGSDGDEGAESMDESIEKINQDIEDYTGMLIEQYKKDMGEAPDASQGLDIDYEVVTDSEDWFTLKISVLETQASGYQHAVYYHIDKRSKETVKLGDLFEGSEYVDVISEEIKRQMRERMAADQGIIYNLDSEEEFRDMDFDKIREDQNFYFDAEGRLVIAFDEYEVAPGYMGSVEFTIPEENIRDILKK